MIISMGIKIVCTPAGRTHPCFQGGQPNRSPVFELKGNNNRYTRHYQRGVATTCCFYGDCTLQYLRTFCCHIDYYD
ncbi:unnamed protein product [Dracunculus medinensis]|uniref:IlGF domain-containing protein n=1 Tax=Dracunculus medinensis TaxID=318479 RepID=A0A0N4U6Z2_DRAME|nr:unnamed protein product [Dracunculus medinensis]